MDINGKKAVKGTGPSVLTDVAAATSTGGGSSNKQWVIKFPNGIKIQSDTIDIGANSGQVQFPLPSAYTGDHFVVMISTASAVTATADEHVNQAHVPTGANKLTHIEAENIGGSTWAFTYLSIGKDL
jgi:hypothetical protein